ncbi:hypothetical protein ACWD3I_20235 [Streptomyces sp. NPDC002817]|uniref:hypothetical protein n=1 Tax=Streptomyces sp. NPDC088357 TaxID=3154655 RepID=UPI0034343601
MTIARLNAFDGLFLRSAHLERMQEYTRSLAYALGRAGGPGVVHGYSTRLSADRLHVEVEPGLAIGATGRPFLLEQSATLDLRDPEVIRDQPGAGTLKLIVATGHDVPFGQENVYGELCAGSALGSTEAYVREDVAVKVVDWPLSGPTNKADSTLRSRVAKLWFEQERTAGVPWIADDDPTDSTDLLRPDWGSGLAPRTPHGREDVPLGVLLHTSKKWVLDVWTVRRERMDSPARRARQQQIGLRPWDVFVAQVLQFQDMLADAWAGATPVVLSTAGDTNREVREKVQAARDVIVSARARASLDAVLKLVPESAEGETTPTALPPLVRGLGIEELPPAGFLPLGAGSDTSVQERIRAMFPGSVELAFHACPVDAVLTAVEAAQHLRRIPLPTADRESRVAVDILVPDGTESVGGLVTDRPWVAFRRHAECGDGLESVDLYLCKAETADTAKTLLDDLATGKLPPAKLKGAQRSVLHYPVGGWALPAEQPTVEQWKADGGLVTALALARSVERQALIAGRAAMLLDVFPAPAGGAPRTGGVFAALGKEPARDAIVLIGHPAPRDGDSPR